MTTPTTIDQFSRYQADTFNLQDMITASTGFQAFFGNVANNSQTIYSPDAEAIDIDIIDGNKKISALIPRGGFTKLLGTNQKIKTTDKFTSTSRVYPLSKEESIVSAGQLLKRLADEPIYSPYSRMQRARYHGRNLVIENQRRTVDMFEVLAAQSILTGKQDTIIGTTDATKQYDFNRSASHIIDGTSVAWTGSSADPMTNCDTWGKLIERNGRAKADFVGMAGDVAQALIKLAAIKDPADNRRFELIRIGENTPVPAKFKRFTDNGWSCFGKFYTMEGRELYLFTYLGYYEDSSGDPVDLLPSGKLIMADSTARCDRYFGPPEVLPMTPAREQFYNQFFGFSAASVGSMRTPAPGNIIDPRMFYHDAYTDSGYTNITIRTWSAPIFATTHTNAFVTVSNLA